MEKRNFSLLLKTESTEVFAIHAYDGYVELYNLSSLLKLKIKFENYEIFFYGFIEIINYFLDNKQFDVNTDYVIKNDSVHTISWNPTLLNNSIKAIALKSVRNCDQFVSFKMVFKLECFLNLVQSFSSCILPSLLLTDHEKLIFQIMLSSSFNWALFNEQSFNQDYFIVFVSEQKQKFSLNIDISNIFSMFKMYYPLLLLLQKTNGLILINLDDSQSESQSSNNLQDPTSFDE